MENEEEQSPQRTGLDSCVLGFAIALLVGIAMVLAIIANIQQQISMGY